MINNSFFNCINKDIYPPFKNGLYLEEYFFEKIQNEKPNLKRKYIPVKWTNFQIEYWFTSKKDYMQKLLDEWIINNPCENGYFTLIQYDDGCLLELPDNTLIYGACSGNIPIPLIYQDINNTLINIPKKKFNEKHTLCCFVGSITANNVEPNVRKNMIEELKSSNFELYYSYNWNSCVNVDLQQKFINTIINSKFSLAPRGYGRSSFRFFESLQLGTIPVYIWNDIEWLPFKNIINYKNLCISIHISKISELEEILNSINEEEYEKMLNYYDEIKYLFELEGMSNQIIKEINM